MKAISAAFSLIVLWALSAAPAAAECRPSASGARSLEVTLSPLSGVLCVSDVRVFEGNSCTARLIWRTTLGCSETRWMVPTDDGQLVSLLSTRANRRTWAIVRLFTFDTNHVAVRSLRLDELPIPADATRPRLELDAAELRVLVTPPVSVSVQTLHTLGARRSARRRAFRGP